MEGIELNALDNQIASVQRQVERIEERAFQLENLMRKPLIYKVISTNPSEIIRWN